MRERLDVLMDSSLARFLSTTRRFGIPEPDGEDLIQETLISWIENHESVRNDEAWVVFALKRRCLMFLRKEKNSRVKAIDSAILSALAEVRSQAEREVLFREIDDAIGELQPRCSALLRARYLQGLTTAEIASMFDYRETSVRKSCARCLAKLVDRLAMKKGLASALQSL